MKSLKSYLKSAKKVVGRKAPKKATVVTDEDDEEDNAQYAFDNNDLLVSTADNEVDDGDLMINLDGFPHDHPFQFDDDCKGGATEDILQEYLIADHLEPADPIVAEVNALDVTTLEEVGAENMIIQANVSDIVKELDTLIDLEQEVLDQEAAEEEEEE